MAEARIKLGIDTTSAEQELKNFAKTSNVITKVKVKLDDNSLEEQYKVIETFVDKAGKSFRRLTEGLDYEGLTTFLEKDIDSFKELEGVINGFVNSDDLKTLTTNLEKGFRETSKSVTSFTDDLGNSISEITEFNQAGEKLITTITKYKNELGQLITETQKYDETNDRLISKNTEVNESLNVQDAKLKETSKTIETLIDREGNMVKVATELDATGKEIVTTTTKQKDEYGNLVTITEKYDKTNNKLISTNREVTKTINEQKQALEEEKNKLKETSKTIETSIDIYGNLKKTIHETDNSGKNLRTEITKEKDAFGNVTTTTKIFDDRLNKLVSTHKEVANATKDVRVKTEGMGQSFLDCVTKVSKFYLATKPIQLVTQAITEGKEALLEYDKALTEFRKVSTLSSNELTGYVDELNQIGQEVGRTVTEMIDSVTQMRKAGYSEEDAKYLARLTELYKNTADEELTSAEASAVLISQMKAFNIEAENAIRITDSINY